MTSWFTKSRALLLGSLILTLAFVVACGTAAPEVVEREVVREVTVEVPVEVPKEVEVIVEREVEVPVEVEVVKEIAKETVVERTVIATPTPIPVTAGPVEAKVERVIYGLGEVQETNRHWTVGRPSYYQFDPYSETLIGIDSVYQRSDSPPGQELGVQHRRSGMDPVPGRGSALPLRPRRVHLRRRNRLLRPHSRRGLAGFRRFLSSITPPMKRWTTTR